MLGFPLPLCSSSHFHTVIFHHCCPEDNGFLTSSRAPLLPPCYLCPLLPDFVPSPSRSAPLPARGLKFVPNTLPSVAIFASAPASSPSSHSQIHLLLLSVLPSHPPTGLWWINLPLGSHILTIESTCVYSALIFLGFFITFTTIINKAQSCFLFTVP